MKRSTLVFAAGVLFFIIASCFAANTVRADDSLSGKVVEAMNSGGYTYVSLEKNGKKTWVAIPETSVKVGQEITCKPGMEMKNFTSKTLKRSFESIIFSSGIR